MIMANVTKIPTTPAFTTASMEIVTITPDLARRWLGLNRKNRAKRPAKINQYARDMQAGRWRFTGEAIKFDTNGDLIDGQNRLNAIILADTPINMLVIRDLQEESQEVMDSGAPRSARDSLFLHGHGTDATRLAATVTVHAQWASGGYKHCMYLSGSFTRPTNAETIDYVDDHPGMIDATRYAPRFRKILPLPVGAMSTAIMEITKIDADDANDFFTRILDFRTEGRGDPVGTLIRRVALMRERRERVLRHLPLSVVPHLERLPGRGTVDPDPVRVGVGRVGTHP